MRLILKTQEGTKTISEHINSLEEKIDIKFEDKHLKHRKVLDYVLGALVLIDLILGIFK